MFLSFVRVRIHTGVTSGLMSSYTWRLLVIAFCQLYCEDVPVWPSISILAPLAESALQTAIARASISPPCISSTALLDLFPSLPRLLWPEESDNAAAVAEDGSRVVASPVDKGVANSGVCDGDVSSSSSGGGTAATTKRKRNLDEAESPPFNGKRARADAAAAPDASASLDNPLSCAELFSAFLRWVACGIDYKGRQVISLEVLVQNVDRMYCHCLSYVLHMPTKVLSF